ncbi:RNA exonuclease 4-like [Vanessa cardui]|uniref:RNA exonuclease 4-like n=1 Tax=Vanessa cardui TaxID=171605 RepID=UPI001F143FE2|nr:RNA exonuclease 4-like [Vanessa cardui]XP_046969001.1 RNA exonuclease 4-like [Vanessa cardui]
MSVTNALAIDCEMVESYNKSLLARVSIVNQHGSTILDEYVKPSSTVTDYRFLVNKKWNIDNGQDFSYVKNKVANLLQGRILVGHSIHFDLEVLQLSHPESKRRDLAKYNRLQKNGQPVALKTLAKNYLGRDIQESAEHDSVEDAKACMDIYLKLAHEWEYNF